ncbi:hypothetical protein DSO57_1008936 [Entomophthora muscae]|uniref:Uncharacterized protein n=1 Tax=Entomophthora muscae TaxID=34485 RepID=A0ACC2T750_9FUNG|nr:hypothetical protein DSO57_1008936 [Entomophthora muscae]
MDYQQGPDPGMAGIPYDAPAPPISQPFDYSRAGMVILIILSLDKAIIPNLGTYRPIAAGLLYLTQSAPFLYWALVTCYLDGLSSPSMPWYMTAPGHDNNDYAVLAPALEEMPESTPPSLDGNNLVPLQAPVKLPPALTCMPWLLAGLALMVLNAYFPQLSPVSSLWFPL